MALTPSTMIPLGTPLIPFELKDAHGQLHSSEDFKEAKALLVVFMCNHCPYVIHIADALAQFYREYKGKGLAMVGINSNDFHNPSYAEDSPEHMLVEIKRRGYEFPYLVDETQEVAKAYDAACTPDLYLFDEDSKLVYRGEFDSSRPGKGQADGASLRQAVECLLRGEPIANDQRPAMGCNIKWRS